MKGLSEITWSRLQFGVKTGTRYKVKIMFGTPPYAFTSRIYLSPSVSQFGVGTSGWGRTNDASPRLRGFPEFSCILNSQGHRSDMFLPLSLCDNFGSVPRCTRFHLLRLSSKFRRGLVSRVSHCAKTVL